MNVIFNLNRCISILIIFTFLFLDLKAVTEESSNLTMAAGWRTDLLQWSISGPDGSPDVLSELKWRELHLWEVRADYRESFSDRFCYCLSGAYGKIFHGRVRDSDYAENHRHMEFSRSISNAGRGEVFDLSAGVGIEMKFFKEILTVTPMAGYALDEQHLTLYDGVQEINLISDDLGFIPGLDSSYRTRWYGLWLGCDMRFAPVDHLELFAGARAHEVRYHAKGHWNLREDHGDDFRHRGKGGGLSLETGIRLTDFAGWSFGLTGSARAMIVNSGKDRTSGFVGFEDDEGNTEIYSVKLTTKLKEVDWASVSVVASAGYSF